MNRLSKPRQLNAYPGQNGNASIDRGRNVSSETAIARWRGPFEVGMEFVEVNRSDLRQHQRALLKLADGQHVLMVKTQSGDKVVVDRQSFDEMHRLMDGVFETLEIVMDRRLFDQIVATADILEERLRLGELYSMEDALQCHSSQS